MTVICKSAAKRRSLILPGGQELIGSRALNRCGLPFTRTRVYTRHTAEGPDLTQQCWPLQGKEQMEWLGLAQGLTPGGSGGAPLMLKNQSRMNRHKGSSWGGGRGRTGRNTGWRWGRREKRKEELV